MNRRTSLAAVALMLATASAPGAIVHTTAGPFGGFFGLWGADVSSAQSVGARFIPTGNYTLTSIKIWFMNNSDSVHPSVKVSLRDDSGGPTSTPGLTTLAQWTIEIAALGWNPVQEIVIPSAALGLQVGKKYWVVAESEAIGGQDAVWNFASSGNAFSSFSQGGSWQAGGSGAALTLTVEGNPGLPTPADFNGDGVVDGSDLTVLLGAWGACSNCAADLNHDGSVSGLDLAGLLSAWTP